MSVLAGTLNFPSKGIVNLTGIEQATGIEHLYVRCGLPGFPGGDSLKGLGGL